MKKRLLTVLTQAILYIVAALVVFLMVMVTVSREWFNVFAGLCGELFLMAFLMAAGIMALWILAELVFVLRTVNRDPFVARNISAFYRMGAIALLASALMIVKCFVDFTVMTAVCALVMVLAGMFSLVLGKVFARAVEYKVETDLTI